MVDGITFRRMTAEDIGTVCELEKAAFSRPWSEQAFRETLAQKDACYVVAVLSGAANEEIVGVCGTYNAYGDGDISNVSVRQDMRGRGIGKAMLLFLMEQGAGLGIVNYTLEVRVSNAAAIHVYEELGFVGEGVRPRFYEDPKEDALIMWKRG